MREFFKHIAQMLVGKSGRPTSPAYPMTVEQLVLELASSSHYKPPLNGDFTQALLIAIQMKFVRAVQNGIQVVAKRLAASEESAIKVTFDLRLAGARLHIINNQQARSVGEILGNIKKIEYKGFVSNQDAGAALAQHMGMDDNFTPLFDSADAFNKAQSIINILRFLEHGYFDSFDPENQNRRNLEILAFFNSVQNNWKNLPDNMYGVVLDRLSRLINSPIDPAQSLIHPDSLRNIQDLPMSDRAPQAHRQAIERHLSNLVRNGIGKQIEIYLKENKGKQLTPDQIKVVSAHIKKTSSVLKAEALVELMGALTGPAPTRHARLPSSAPSGIGHGGSA